MVIEPVELPKQATLVCEVTEALSAAAGWVIVAVAVVEHRLASVTVTM